MFHLTENLTARSLTNSQQQARPVLEAQLLQALLIILIDNWDSTAGPAVNRVSLNFLAHISIVNGERILITDTTYNKSSHIRCSGHSFKTKNETTTSPYLIVSCFARLSTLTALNTENINVMAEFEIKNRQKHLVGKWKFSLDYSWRYWVFECFWAQKWPETVDD